MTTSSLEKQRIEILYSLLEETEKQNRSETASVLRWAIFQLENKFSEKEESKKK